jgi:hypothetical protein
LCRPLGSSQIFSIRKFSIDADALPPVITITMRKSSQQHEFAYRPLTSFHASEALY